jgi:hypothetical protein
MPGSWRAWPQHIRRPWRSPRLPGAVEIDARCTLDEAPAGFHAASHLGEHHMRIERLEKRASENKPVARPSLNKDVRLKDQRRAELLRSRIEELDRRLAILKSEREKGSGFWKSRKPGFVAWTTPALWQRLLRFGCG